MRNIYDILNDVKMDFSIYDEEMSSNPKEDTKTNETNVLPKSNKATQCKQHN